MRAVDLRAAISLVLLAAFTGCRIYPPPPDHSDLDAAAAREFVRAQALAVKDLEAQVSLSLETADFSGSLEGALVIEPPDRMRLRTTKMMQDVFDLVVTPRALELFWFPDRVLYRKRAATTRAEGSTPTAAATRDGAASGGDSRAVAFLKTLDPGAMRASLTAFELPRADASASSPWQARVVGERLERTHRTFTVEDDLEDGGRLTRKFDGASLLLESADVSGRDGKAALHVTFKHYRPVGTLWLPESTTLEDLRFGTTFSMEFSDIAVNEGVLPGAFELTLPADVTVHELE